MWGKRRQGSRRGHQRYTLLNVDLPAEKVRQQRLRWAARTAGFVLGAVALFVGVWHGGGWLLKSGFYHNDHFSVRSVDIRTDGVIQASEFFDFFTKVAKKSTTAPREDVTVKEMDEKKKE